MSIDFLSLCIPKSHISRLLSLPELSLHLCHLRLETLNSKSTDSKSSSSLAFDHTSDATQLKPQLGSISASISNLEKLVPENSYLLPSYEVSYFQLTVHSGSTHLIEAKNLSLNCLIFIALLEVVYAILSFLLKMSFTFLNLKTTDFLSFCKTRHIFMTLKNLILSLIYQSPKKFALGDTCDMEELTSLPLEKILLRWMNFQLNKSAYRRTITNFSTDVKRLMLTSYKFLHPKHSKPSALDAEDPFQIAKLVLAHADRMGCKRYLTVKDIIEGSPNLNLTFVAHQISFLETSLDDTQISREKRVFCFWINSFGNSTYIHNAFEDLRNGWVLLETLDKISPGIVNWKIANKPPIKMPFRKVENCNQVVKLRKQLKFSLVNIAGNDIFCLSSSTYLWQLMRYNILQLPKNLRFHSHGKEITDADILEWANTKVSNTGSQVRMDSFKGKSLSDGIFFLELHSAVQPSVVNWSLVTKDVTEEHKKMNASYIISIARKLGCSIFLLPEDITDICSICFFICPSVYIYHITSLLFFYLNKPCVFTYIYIYIPHT
ncbi:hypothetical protein UlMin_042498 [Ulmus minor]